MLVEGRCKLPPGFYALLTPETIWALKSGFRILCSIFIYKILCLFALWIEENYIFLVLPLFPGGTIESLPFLELVSILCVCFFCYSCTDNSGTWCSWESGDQKFIFSCLICTFLHSVWSSPCKNTFFPLSLGLFFSTRWMVFFLCKSKCCVLCWGMVMCVSS